MVPLQHVVDKPSPTHRFINQQALTILGTDGHRREAMMLSRYLESFNSGCDWADTDWRNVGHMYNPKTGMGFRGWPSAPQMLREYWDKAVRFHVEWQFHDAFFYLGAASHLVQDLCVPHHAAAKMFAGHKEFETYACRHRNLHAVQAGGMYGFAATPEGWVTRNADYTLSHYGHCVSSRFDPKATEVAVADLLPRAQRLTAGFVKYFLEAREGSR